MGKLCDGSFKIWYLKTKKRNNVFSKERAPFPFCWPITDSPKMKRWHQTFDFHSVCSQCFCTDRCTCAACVLPVCPSSEYLHCRRWSQESISSTKRSRASTLQLPHGASAPQTPSPGVTPDFSRKGRKSSWSPGTSSDQEKGDDICIVVTGTSRGSGPQGSSESWQNLLY